MSKKQTRLLILFLPVLGVLAVVSNADTLFGKSAPEASPVIEAPASPPPPQESKPAEPSETPSNLGAMSGEAKTVPEGSLEFLNRAADGERNPFLTQREQDPGAPVDPEVDPLPNQGEELPLDLALQLTFIQRDHRIATLVDGRRIQEGEAFYGGKVVAIEKERAVVEFKNGRRWVIPMRVAPPLKEGKKENESP